MEQRTLGRPKAENPKDIQLKIRADRQLIEDLEYCCKQSNLTKSDIIRLGIKRIKQAVENGESIEK